MKKFFIILTLLALGLSAEFISQEQLNTLSTKLVREIFGPDYRHERTIIYYGDDELPNAFSYVYKNHKAKIANIVLGARITCSPICEISERLPNYYTNLNKAKGEGEKRLNGSLEFDRIYYFGPLEEYFGFKSSRGEVLINTYSLRMFEKDWFFNLIRQVKINELAEIVKEKWNRYLNQSQFFRDTVMNYVDSVPFIDWVYGCSPTAASMILWYWDPRGYGKLVDYFFTRWDYPEGEWNDCANVNRELALRMYTDTLTGGTYITNIGPGIVATCNSINGYSFTSQTSPMGTPFNQFNFSWIKSEIDNQRPCHWNVMHYQGDPNFNHSVTGVGYAYGSSLPDTFVIVHDTWTGSEPWWPLWTYMNGVQSYDYVVRVIPGGSNPNNILLDYPLGGDVYAMPVMFKNLKYSIRWHSQGADVDHIKMWWSKGVDGYSYDSLYWTLIGANIPDTGRYIWTCPTEICSLRINIAALNTSNIRLAADGSFGRTRVCELSHSPNVNLVGHYDTPVWANDVVISGEYAYVADGTGGLLIIDVGDSSLPDYVNQVPLAGNSGTTTLSDQYLFIGDREDTLRILSLSNPTNPVQVGKLAFSDDVLGIEVVGSNAYVCARSQGLVIVDVQDPSNPMVIGSYNTSGFSYDVVVSNNLAYVADATRGVRVIDVSNPISPVEVGFYDTNGITYGVDKSGNYVYAADGTAGIKVFDATSSDTLILLGSLDTPGTASGIEYYNGHIFVADGTMGGIRIINVTNPSTPSESGYILSLSTTNASFIRTPLVYLPDGNSGLLIVKQDIVGIQESPRESLPFTMRILPRLVTPNQVMKVQCMSNREVSGRIEVFDVSGRKVETVYQGKILRGCNEFLWVPKNLASGIYFIRVKTDTEELIDKFLVIR